MNTIYDNPHFIDLNIINICWFLDTHYDLNSSNCTLIADNIIQINQLFTDHQHNYKLFIDGIVKLFNLNDTDKLKYLECEKYCMQGHINYPITRDPFVTIYDYYNHKDITYQLCYTCCQQALICPCHYVIGGPWENFYLNLKINQSMCEICFHSPLAKIHK